MKARTSPASRIASLLGLTAICVITASTFFAPPTGLSAQSAEKEQAISKKLGDNLRYLTHISTDKPLYRPGETMYIRAVTLDGFSRAPIAAAQQSVVELIAPSGESLFKNSLHTEDAVLGTAWEIPKELSGGEYTIKVSHDWMQDSVATRKIDIRAYRAPRLKSQIEFVRKGYGPGDTASASIKVERAEGGAPTGAKVTAIARIDGAEVWRGPATISAEGTCGVAFDLPAEIERGEGTLLFVIEDGGVVETASKTIPILAQAVDLAAYPEGGDLVVGIESRIYIEAQTPWGEPADITAEIVDQDGEVAGVVKTSHEGRGVGSFTPAKRKSYSLRVAKPASVKTTLDLPPVKTSGVVLAAKADSFASYAPVEMTLTASHDERYRIAVFEREREVSGAMFDLKAGVTKDVMLTPPATADGVLRVTVFDRADNPLAERLIYRMPTETLNIDVKAKRDRYLPGDVVELEVTTTDSSGAPVSAVVGVTVTDDAVLEMIETRKQAPRLPAMAMLEAEVQHLEDAQIYLDGSAEGADALDLLLGTQGWRRFAYENVDAFMATHPEQAKRVLAYGERNMPSPSTGRWERARGFGGGGAPGAPNNEMDDEDGAGAEPQPDAAPMEGAQGNKKEAVREADKGAADPVDDPREAAKPGQRAKDMEKNDAGENDAKEDAQKARAPEEEREVEEDNAARPADRNDEPQRDELRRLRKRVEQQAQVLKPIRIYAHMVRASRKAGDRRDFAETLYWAAGLKTNEEGKANISFGLSDAVTSFRVMADGFTAGGSIGSSDTLIESRQPFFLEAKLPLEVTAGDRVDVPVSLVNGTNAQLNWQVQPSVQGFARLQASADQAGPAGTMSADQRVRTLVPLTISQGMGDVSFSVSGSAGPFSDSVTRSIKVVPAGFPISQTVGGMLEADSTIQWEVNLPQDVVSGSAATAVNVYPTPLANLTGALESLIREPHGCFEQTSSTTYPLIMAQQYFKSHIGVDPALISRANTMLDKGYKRLTSYECSEGGFEWFGGNPGHEALTAYGVLEFIDLAQVYDVDKEMLSRTRTWLMSKRDGEGGFLRNPRALDSFGGAPQDITDAYIVWSLTEAGELGLETEVNALATQAATSKDPYLKGLVAGSLYNLGRNDEALTHAKSLLEHQQDDGCVIDALTSITRSGGDALKIETTSIAVLVWLDDPQFTENVESAMQWLTSTCKDGRFGSTQSTVLALKAITAYDAARATPKADGEVIVKVDGNQVATIAFTKDEQGQITLPDLSPYLASGKQVVSLEMKGGSRMPFSMALNYNSPLPVSSAECDVQLSTKLSSNEITEGEGGEVSVSVKNLAKTGQGMATAIIGLPGGLEPRHDQLKQLVEMGTIDFYEVRGREVICYWRDMAPEQAIDFKIDVIAAIPGEYTGPASRGYLYYTDEYKHWVAGMHVTIAPRQ